LLADYFRIPDDQREAFVAFARAGYASPDSAHVGNQDNAGEPYADAPWLHLYARRTNIPAVLTPIIGRDTEERELRNHLLSLKARLITLVGTGGIGKTRLALQAAAGLVSHFPDGVFFVDLAAVADPDLVLPTVARALGFQEGGNQSLKDMLFNYVCERRMLLVLDNFEQVLDAGADIVRLLETGPWLKALVTSREALRVRGEQRFVIPPLAFPDVRWPWPTPPEGPKGGTHNTQSPQDFPAVQLFLERARGVAPDLELTQADLADVATVCAVLDGLPLAIELAAARCHHYSPADIRRSLSSPLGLLTGGARDAPPRHRTMRSTIDWSYNLLNPDEQSLFRRLSVFAGGFTLEAVDAVCAERPTAGAVAGEAPAELLMSLVDKHLVRRKAGQSREARFSLLEPVREYLVEQILKRGELADLRGRHAHYYSSMAEAAETHFTGEQSPDWGTRQVLWIDLLEVELDNMRLALEWCAAGDVALVAGAAGNQPYAAVTANVRGGLRLATALRRVWLGRGYIIEGLQWLRRFISLLPLPLPAGDRELRSTYVTALNIQARLCIVEGNAGIVRPTLAESVRLAAELGDKQQLAMAWFNLGSVALAGHDYPASRAGLEEGLKLFRELDNSWGIAATLEDLGSVEVQTNPQEAKLLFEESLALYRRVGERFGAASALEGLGRVQYSLGNYNRAVELWEDSLRLSEETGYKSRASSSLLLLGQAALRQRRYGQAQALCRSAMLLAHKVGSWSTVYSSLVKLAELASARNRPERAAQLLAAAARLVEARGLKLSPADIAEFESGVTETRARMESGDWHRAWDRGRQMDLDSATKYATE
jgi:predicted ATPase/tetratricopeptide (TPR) repeat protein